MIRLARVAVLPMVAAAALLGAGTALAADASPMATCSGTYTFGGATVTVRCPTTETGTEFRAVAVCPNGATHVGAWVLQGPGHVSVAKCGNPMAYWGWDVR